MDPATLKAPRGLGPDQGVTGSTLPDTQHLFKSIRENTLKLNRLFSVFIGAAVLSMAAGAAPVISAITNAASGVVGGKIVGGAMYTAWGTNLGANISGSTVLVGSLAVTPSYVSASQVNFQAPTNLVTSGTITIRISTSGMVSNALTLSLAPYDPALYGCSGPGSPWIEQWPTYAVVGPCAAPNTIHSGASGAVLVFFGNAFGADLAACSSFSVSVGGVAAPVLYCGLASGSTTEYQLNVQVSSITPHGADAVVIYIDGVPLQVFSINYQQ